MTKIPFDIKYRPQIESGEYKVETNEGYSVRIVCWDAKRKYGDCICGFMGEEEDKPYFWQPDGSWWADHTQSPLDLFIITPEPELTEFEEHLKQLLDFSVTLGSPYEIDCIKSEAAELLELARKQLIEEQYTSDLRNTDLYKLSKAEALKDLPRWENVKIPATDIAKVWVDALDTFWLQHKNKKIRVQSLEKLPGFEEN